MENFTICGATHREAARPQLIGFGGAKHRPVPPLPALGIGEAAHIGGEGLKEVGGGGRLSCFPPQVEPFGPGGDVLGNVAVCAFIKMVLDRDRRDRSWVTSCVRS